MIVEGYSMELYCDNGAENDGIHGLYFSQQPVEIAGSSRADCLRQAAARGWLITKKHKCYCPKCAPKFRKEQPCQQSNSAPSTPTN